MRRLHKAQNIRRENDRLTSQQICIQRCKQCSRRLCGHGKNKDVGLDRHGAGSDRFEQVLAGQGGFIAMRTIDRVCLFGAAQNQGHWSAGHGCGLRQRRAPSPTTDDRDAFKPHRTSPAYHRPAAANAAGQR